jgi:hypothetical protein
VHRSIRDDDAPKAQLLENRQLERIHIVSTQESITAREAGDADGGREAVQRQQQWWWRDLHILKAAIELELLEVFEVGRWSQPSRITTEVTLL